VSLGGSITITAAVSAALTIGTGLSGTSYNGSTAVTIANTGVLSWDGGTTGLTPATATTGAVTLGGTLVVANGGTGATTAATARANLSAAVLGANNDITSMTGLTGGISSPDFITFDLAPDIVPTTEGSMYWNTSDRTLDLIMRGGNVIQQIGEEQYYTVRNATGTVIPDGTPVYASGVTAGSGRIEAAPAIADGSIDELRFLGLTTENINNGINGYVTSFGYVRGLDTRGDPYGETWAVGDIIYVSPTTPGALTNIRPTAPNLTIVVAIVIIRNQTQGVLFVRPTAYPALQDLSNVYIPTPSNGDVIVYDSTDQRWENAAQSTLTAGAATNLAGGAASQIPYQTGAGATAFIPNGTAGQVLTSAGASAPTWSGISGGLF
jgi:hypothetical protein